MILRIIPSLLCCFDFLLVSITVYIFILNAYKSCEFAGSDLGAFLLARPGFYVRETEPGTFIIFLVFKGTDLHSGTAPTANDDELNQFFSLLAAELASEDIPRVNRVVYVAYTSSSAFQREGRYSVYPDVGAADDDNNDLAFKSTQLNYAQHGQHILGTRSEAVAKLFAEAYSSYANRLATLPIVFPPEDFSQYQLVTEEGRLESLNVTLLDHASDGTGVDRWRRFYKHIYQLAHEYLVQITKDQYRTAQAGAIAELEQTKVDQTIHRDVEKTRRRLGLLAPLDFNSEDEEDIMLVDAETADNPAADANITPEEHLQLARVLPPPMNLGSLNRGSRKRKHAEVFPSSGEEQTEDDDSEEVEEEVEEEEDEEEVKNRAAGYQSEDDKEYEVDTILGHEIDKVRTLSCYYRFHILTFLVLFSSQHRKLAIW